MWKSFAINKYICVYIFFLLFNPITNDKEAYFYFTDGSRTWKFSLNDSKNAVAFKEKLKSKKSMRLEFQPSEEEGIVDNTETGWNRLFTCDCSSSEFGFESTGNTEGKFEKYEIIAASAQGIDSLCIVVENRIRDIAGYKIGEIIEGIDDPSELDSIMDEIFVAESGIGPIRNFTFAYSDVKLEESETKEKIAILILMFFTIILLCSCFSF